MGEVHLVDGQEIPIKKQRINLYESINLSVCVCTYGCKRYLQKTLCCGMCFGCSVSLTRWPTCVINHTVFRVKYPCPTGTRPRNKKC